MAKITLRASGAQAPDDMRAGEWAARCDRGELKQRGNKISAVLSFTVVGRFGPDGFVSENAGVLLKQWYFLAELKPNQDDIVLDIQPYSKYGTAWALAMGRSFKSGEIPSPEAFEKKLFRVDVGFSSAAGGSFSYRNQGRKKDPRDFLRIHTILEKIEEKALTHMSPCEPIGDHKHEHVHVNGHEHAPRASAVASAQTSASADSNGIRMSSASHKGNEQAPQGHHANGAPGESPETTGISERDVIRVFPGARTRKQV
jgi:hypothetical protein